MLCQIKITASPINHPFIIFLCILLLTLFNADLTAQYIKPNVKFLNIEEGLKHNTVLEIEQDKYGFLWFGTFQGLTRYNGNNFISEWEELPITTARDEKWSIVRDNKGNLWMIMEKALYKYDYDSENWILKGNTKIYSDPRSFQMAIDKAGNIWCARFDTLYRYELRTDTLYATYKITFKDKETSIELQPILFDSSNELWLGSNEKGLFKLMANDHDTCIVKVHLRKKKEVQYPLTIWSLHQDVSNQIWAGTSKGIIMFYPDNIQDSAGIYYIKDDAEDYPILTSYYEDKDIFAIQSDEYGNLFIRSASSIDIYYKELNKIEILYQDEILLDGAEGSPEHVLFYIPGRVLLFGSHQGVGKINLGNNCFEVYQHNPEDPNSLGQNSLNQVIVDKNNHLWVGTTKAGLNRGIPEIDGKGYRFEHYDVGDNKKFTSHAGGYDNFVSDLYEDSNGNIWVGNKSFQRFDDSGITVKFIPADFTKKPGYNTMVPRITWVTEDVHGNLWIATENQTIIFNPLKNTNHILYLDPYKRITYTNGHLRVTDDKKHYLTFGSRTYEIHFPLKHIDSTSVYPSKTIPIIEFPYGVGKNHAHFITKSGRFTELLTTDLKRFRIHDNPDNEAQPKVEFIKQYSLDDGICNVDVKEMIEDDKGRIWISTQHGLACFFHETESFHNFYIEDGLPTNKFYWGNYKDKNGKLYFCTTNGLVVFHPDSVLTSLPPKVLITGFRLFNKTVKPGKDSPLQQSITKTRKLELTYNQNYLSFEYTALDYINPSLNRFRYKMEGLEEEWVIAGNNRMAVYTDIDPGRYTFRVIGSNHNNVWNMEGVSLDITIFPPPWQTWYAYIVYGIILLGIILLYRRFLLRRARLKTALEIERVEKGKVLEMDQMKSRFFTNISHEFRTPLTLILGPIEDIFRSKKGSLNLTRDTLQMIRRNTKRLQRLINQMLDISKLETGNMKLMVAQGNLTAFCRTIIQSFLSLAESKKINYEYHLSDPDNEQYYDADKLEKILSNLLSNAFKFTPEKGSIKVNLSFYDSADEATAFAELSVKDTGVGIPGDKAEKIFDRFYQVSSSDDRDAEGTGIGLSLTRELVELYRGEIQVESTPGKGSQFTIKIPFLKHQFKPEEFCDPEMVKDATTEFTDEIATQEKIPESAKPDTQLIKTDESESLILVVEDNSDLRKYITEHLKQDHTLLEAKNGNEGFNRATEHIPDLIITDLMMPVMDGMEMCRLLKADERTNHIPVIMLTAKADRESKLSGLKTGADDYLIKPFDAEELKVRVKNIILQRQKLSEKFRKDFFASASNEDQMPPRDQLIGKLFKIFEEHLDNADFDIEKLGSEINMSRAQVFRKINTITGNTPKELLRNFRLQKAARLFSSGHDQITQVMLQVGFNNSSYFTKCFRELYGTTPSEYIKNNTKKS